MRRSGDRSAQLRSRPDMSAPDNLTVNGLGYTTSADGATPLLDVLRNELGLMATRFGCGAESCGACMVLVDGTAAYACTLTLEALAGRRVTTLEGIGTPDAPHPLQRAFLDEQAGQCGYCLSGIIISAKALLDRNVNPNRAEIASALDKHLCRCGAHARIIKAVERAAAAMRANAGDRR
jgi:nicotinate dehydrogenase subunit A